MKDLTNYVNENLNESALGVAGGIVLGLLGFKVLQGLFTGLLSVGVKKLNDVAVDKAHDEIRRIDKEMFEILKRNPEAFKAAQEVYEKYYKKDGSEIDSSKIAMVDYEKVTEFVSDEDKAKYEALLKEAHDCRKKYSKLIVQGLNLHEN